MTDATMVLEADGRAVDASPAALELLGVTLEQLQAMPPGAFSPNAPDPAEAAAFRSAWEASGSPGLFGESTIVRTDGTHARVRFAITPHLDGRFLVGLESTRTPLDEEPRLYTAGEILTAWRAAERQLVALEPGSAEHVAAEAEIATFRERYQRLFLRA